MNIVKNGIMQIGEVNIGQKQLSSAEILKNKGKNYEYFISE
jgi:hypothetical protein